MAKRRREAARALGGRIRRRIRVGIRGWLSTVPLPRRRRRRRKG